jgi:hypothetical protein
MRWQFHADKLVIVNACADSYQTFFDDGPSTDAYVPPVSTVHFASGVTSLLVSVPHFLSVHK